MIIDFSEINNYSVSPNKRMCFIYLKSGEIWKYAQSLLEKDALELLIISLKEQKIERVEHSKLVVHN